MSVKDKAKASKIVYLTVSNVPSCPKCKKQPQMMIKVDAFDIADFLVACFECKVFSKWGGDDVEATENWRKRARVREKWTWE